MIPAPTLLSRLAAVCAALLLSPLAASAQVEVKPVKAAAAPAAGAPKAQLDMAPLDLGETDDQPAPRARPQATATSTVATVNSSPARSAARVASPAVSDTKGIAPASEAIERVIFDRKPVRVALPVNRERLVTFNQPVALNAPEDIASYARINIVGKTMYVTALMPFGSVRVFVEQLDGEQLQIPLDLVADRSTAAASSEIQIFGRAETQPKSVATAAAGAGDKSSDARAARDDADEVSIDAVMLTRYAARRLYAPWRLTGGDPAIHQVPLELKSIPDLYRGARVQTTPIGAWRAGSLWVTAVRMTNLEPSPLEIRLEDIRGNWITSTAHSGVLGRAGSETDTTALYLVCDRPFEACR